MAKGSSGISNIVLCVLALAICGVFCVANFSNSWVVANKTNGGALTTATSQGIWKTCNAQGVCTSRKSVKMGSKPKWVSVNQVVIPIAIGFSLIAALTSLAGHPCMSKFNVPPAMMMLITGLLLLAAGTAALVGTSWAVNAVQTNCVTNAVCAKSGPGKIGVKGNSVGWTCILAMIFSILAILITPIGIKKFLDNRSSGSAEEHLAMNQKDGGQSYI